MPVFAAICSFSQRKIANNKKEFAGNKMMLLDKQKNLNSCTLQKSY